MEKAVLVGLITPSVSQNLAYEYLEELAFLSKTAGASPIKRFTQRLTYANNKTFVGKGKIEEIRLYVKDNHVDVIIFDDDLTPSQIKNIERIFEGKHKILDRSNLILDIFASRAQTAQARTQVELAQYQYLLPRLTRMWTHLERQKGGIGMRGPGETQIETDRQIIRNKIASLKKKLEKIDKQSSTRRKGREHLIRVALVGYTNAGKSTLMNKLAKSDVFAEDKLFATLDTTVRKVVIGNLPFLLTDTVGFIRKLPHQLIESFKSTLDEVREADFIIHLVDISNPNFEEHINVVNKTISEIGVNDKPTLLVFNKIDAYTFIEKETDDLTPVKKENLSLQDLQKTWMSKIELNTMFISALNKTHFDDLREEMYLRIKKLHEKRYPYNNFLF
ncbi:MAG: GTPase HflX [Flavobacteriales bacterium]|nr:GTPase HflX [Flavobacteriales bacterium]|tara:strand:+ start:335 stop:1504 length:1170 start_codon:yes stop_codon:yes gene_type:complete